MLLLLDDFPAAHYLRVVMDSPRVVVHETAARMADVEPDLATKWTNRSWCPGWPEVIA